MKTVLTVLLLSTSVFGQASLVSTPNTGSAPLTVTLTVTCPTCLVYTWNFGDGTPPPPKNLIQVHTYKNSGTYQVIFAGSDKNGLPLNASTTITVSTLEDNIYCSQRNIWTGGTSDGPAVLPKTCFNTAIANTPSPGAIIIAQPQKLQAAYDAAKCGDTIKLAHGQIWTAPFKFTSKNCDDQHWITITTDGTLVPPGKRVSQADAIQMPKLSFGSIGISVWGDHIRFIGIEWNKKSNFTGDTFQYAVLTGAYKIIFDRNYLHGTSGQESQHGIQVNTGKYIAVIDSYMSEFHCIAITGACIDAQAISGGTGGVGVVASGPVKIVNNYLEASGENILFGGAAADGCGPNDVEIRHNYMFKPMRWNPADPSYVPPNSTGHPYVTKNLFELKNGCRFLIEGNVMQNNWMAADQRGIAVLLTPKNQGVKGVTTGSGLCPKCTVEDITIRYNYITTASGFVEIGSGPNDQGQYSMGQHRTSIHDNVADNLQYSTCYKCSPNLNQLSTYYSTVNPPPVGEPLSDILVQNNTIIAVGNLATGQFQTSALFVMRGIPPGKPIPQSLNVTIINSIASTQKNGFVNAGGGTDNCMDGSYTSRPPIPRTEYPACWKGNSQFTGNVLVGYPGKQTDWPLGNRFEVNFSTLFVNFNGGNDGDYHLVTNSPYMGKGANIDKVNASIAGVR